MCVLMVFYGWDFHPTRECIACRSTFRVDVSLKHLSSSVIPPNFFLRSSPCKKCKAWKVDSEFWFKGHQPADFWTSNRPTPVSMPSDRTSNLNVWNAPSRLDNFYPWQGETGQAKVRGRTFNNSGKLWNATGKIITLHSFWCNLNVTTKLKFG